MGAIAAMFAGAVLSGRGLAGISKPGLRRAVGWALVVLLVGVADWVLLGAGAIVRMVGICLVLFGGMKALVYSEWVGRQRLSMGRYLWFSLLWFGMNPGDFGRRVVGLKWRHDALVGLVLTGAGLLLAWGVWWSGWRQVALVFVPLSLAFHFGGLRMLKAGLRFVGFPVRTLFGNVLGTAGLADFWGRRWNAGYSQMMQRLVGRPVERRLGPAAGVLAVFVGSGLLHEFAITLPVRSGFGGPTLYFLLQGLLTLGEKRGGRPWGAVPTLLVVGLPLGLLFPPAFRAEVMVPCLELVGEALAGRVSLGW